MRWKAYGPDALLVHFADEVGETAFERGRILAAALERHPPRGLREFVPAFTSVLLKFAPIAPPDPPEVLDFLQKALAGGATAAGEAPLREIPLHYDGEDLPLIAEKAGLTEREVIDRHATPVYRVYAMGFSPGFAYLGDLDPALHTPRLATPRSKVPAGSVAIGGEHTGVYPQAGPGGWNLIGRTELSLFDPLRPETDAFFLRAGDRVRFVPV